MPRLPVWLASTALLCGGSYAFYYHFYIPRHTTQRQLEIAIGVERMELQSLLQRYAILQNAALLLSRNATSATNKERFSIFCELQRLREAFYKLPKRIQSASEKEAVLRGLDELERTHCTVLNYRDEALTMWQVLTCQFCFGIYVLFFYVFDPLLRQMRCEVIERFRRQGLHLVSRWILRRLSISATMTVEKELPIYFSSCGGCGGSSENDADADDDDDRYYIVFSPQHWIEVVGFWACATNPLLLSARVSLLPPHNTLSDGVPFETYWHNKWRQRVWCDFPDTKTVGKKQKENSGECEKEQGECRPRVQLSFGYPLVPHVVCRQEPLPGDASGVSGAGAPRLVPVVSYGMPRVLFVGDAVARRDLREAPTQHTIYARLREKQYSAHRITDFGRRAGGDVDAADCPFSNDDGYSKGTAVAQLRAWRQNGGVPVWHPAEWGAVYGGVSAAGNRDRRELTYCVGKLCYAAELIDKQMDLLHKLLNNEEEKSDGKEKPCEVGLP